MFTLTESDEWGALQEHYDSISNVHLKTLFEKDKERFDKFHIKFNDILFDFSKNRLDNIAFKLLVRLAEHRKLKEKIKAMFTGEKINTTENRAVLHTALRNRSIDEVIIEGRDIMTDIKAVLKKMKKFVGDVHTGKWKGCTGMPISHIVNIGIGGSHLGPAMICEALKPYAKPGISVHFVSNIDGCDIAETLKQLNPETTLFLIASKTFTTQETMTNANTAKKWFLSTDGKKESDIALHFIALSTNTEAVKQFGINPKNMFEFWDWVGGRYSLWSAIGLSIALYIGFDNFEMLLQGAYEMDMHFRNAPYEENIPVIMALLGIWYVNFFNAKTHAVIPYYQNLRMFPEFLQQLDMESNGKRVDKFGELVEYSTGPVVWGVPGTNAQHSFFQLIHQGTQIIPVDFIAPLFTDCGNEEQRRILLSNLFAQSEALMKGKTEVEVKAELTMSGIKERDINKIIGHKIFPGNIPSNTILLKKLNPETLGSLIAMYEHKVFVQGAIWDINSFDQWGVELGKQLAKKILPELDSDNEITIHDSSTNGLINYYKENKNK
ncbi:MAG: glucose-6-phosphate isomerase [Bacteroidetes bacterium]|nr:MAG: glucose-6-phosphate isomerase [Bacteroidota bacterium]